MRRCLTLAKQAQGLTSPNPMVGAVVVVGDEIIGEGFHQRHGGAHAEVNAIAAVRDKTLLEKATLFVNLEPCSHYGLTPPCAELILKCGIPRVVVGTLDPHEKVAGRGIALLKNGGVEVETGVCADECEFLNRRFFTFHRKKRPFIILKWAQSADGFLAKNGERTSFSTPQTWEKVYQLRASEDAILIGKRTALIDNPTLSAHGVGRDPLRIVIDRKLEIPPSHNLFDQTQKTVIFTERNAESKANLNFVQLDFSREIVPQILSFLHAKNVLSLVVEGGKFTLEKFLAADLVDEIRIETAPILLKNGTPAPKVDLQILQKEIVGENEILLGKLK